MQTKANKKRKNKNRGNKANRNQNFKRDNKEKETISSQKMFDQKANIDQTQNFSNIETEKEKNSSQSSSSSSSNSSFSDFDPNSFDDFQDKKVEPEESLPLKQSDSTISNSFISNDTKSSILSKFADSDSEKEEVEINTNINSTNQTPIKTFSSSQSFSKTDNTQNQALNYNLTQPKKSFLQKLQALKNENGDEIQTRKSDFGVGNSSDYYSVDGTNNIGQPAEAITIKALTCFDQDDFHDQQTSTLKSEGSSTTLTSSKYSSKTRSTLSTPKLNENRSRSNSFSSCSNQEEETETDITALNGGVGGSSVSQRKSMKAPNEIEKNKYERIKRSNSNRSISKQIQGDINSEIHLPSKQIIQSFDKNVQTDIDGDAFETYVVAKNVERKDLISKDFLEDLLSDSNINVNTHQKIKELINQFERCFDEKMNAIENTMSMLAKQNYTKLVELFEAQSNQHFIEATKYSKRRLAALTQSSNSVNTSNNTTSNSQSFSTKFCFVFGVIALFCQLQFWFLPFLTRNGIDIFGVDPAMSHFS